MADIIPFKSRAQLEQGKKERIQAEWEEWLKFEDQYLKQEREDNFNNKDEHQKENKYNGMTEQEIVEDAKQYLTEEEIQAIKEFDKWLDKDSDK
ncbi:hypothetical protein [Virgibacillus ainsalahensis]